jgi:NAD(P)H-hydrate epimerase
MDLTVSHPCSFLEVYQMWLSGTGLSTIKPPWFMGSSWTIDRPLPRPIGSKSMEVPLPGMEVVSTLPVLPARPADSNKGSFGRVLVVAGSRGMSGAAVLCGQAALRGGAGLVRVAVPHESWAIVAAANPCYLTAPLVQDGNGQLAREAIPVVLDLIQANTVVALGPGLGTGPAITDLVMTVLARAGRPLVLDADGLNALGKVSDQFQNLKAPLVLTPHPGEFARLIGSNVPAVQANRMGEAIAFAARHRVILVLKGHDTVVTDGRRLYINSTGNPGMATGGTGDVLTGLIAALLAQGLAPFEGAQLGVYLHGRAGDLARDLRGEVSVIASDLLDFLPPAIRAASISS